MEVTQPPAGRHASAQTATRGRNLEEWGHDPLTMCKERTWRHIKKKTGGFKLHDQAERTGGRSVSLIGKWFTPVGVIGEGCGLRNGG